MSKQLQDKNVNYLHAGLENGDISEDEEAMADPDVQNLLMEMLPYLYLLLQLEGNEVGNLCGKSAI